jgi:NADPH:quinone reductase
MGDVPETTFELRSTVTGEGDAVIALHECAVRAPAEREVVVRIEAAPINPSDLGLLFGRGDVAKAESLDDGVGLRIPLSAGALAANAARVGIELPAGNEGGGVVVAAGDSPAAQALVGRLVGFRSGNAYAGYRTIPVENCVPMPDSATAEQAAASFVNPLTALGMVETMRAEGHPALVHTVGASNLGLMLNRLCLADGVPLVNIVRRPEHVELLAAEGADHVVDSSAESFGEDLVAALRSTGATIAFDAIGGGEMASTLLAAMEQVASEGSEFSRYGSDTHKQVYVYGSLDPGPTVLNRTFGLSWSVSGWLLTPFLRKLGADGVRRLQQRVADGISTIFASRYGMRLSLREAVEPEVARRYGRMASGDKALIAPQE